MNILVEQNDDLTARNCVKSSARTNKKGRQGIPGLQTSSAYAPLTILDLRVRVFHPSERHVLEIVLCMRGCALRVNVSK